MKGVDNLSVRDVPGGAAIAVKVVPGASRDRIVGVLGDNLKIATASPPEKGKANQAVASLLAQALGLGGPAVSLIAGPASPRKEFLIVGMTAQSVRQALAKLP